MAAPRGGSEPLATFEPARAGDIASLVAIDATSPTPWTSPSFEAELRHEPPTLFVLRDVPSAAVLAFVAIRVQAGEMDIVNLAVAPARRRRGLGAALVRGLLEAPVAQGVESVFLEVRAGNAAALALYGRLGFTQTQRRRNFYRDPVEDAVLMALKLSHQDG